MMRIKVCGMTQARQVQSLADLGVHYAGFIFYAPSPRYALQSMHVRELQAIRCIEKVGVFVNAKEKDVLSMAEACHLQLVQLHGEESPAFCRSIARHIPVIKAFRIGEQDDVARLCAPYAAACALFLFDTKGDVPGGTGKKFSWSQLPPTIDKPYFLSGGVGPGDVPDILAHSRTPNGKALTGVDINSQFEVSPGVKRMDAVENFVRQLLRTNQL